MDWRIRVDCPRNTNDLELQFCGHVSRCTHASDHSVCRFSHPARTQAQPSLDNRRDRSTGG